MTDAEILEVSIHIKATPVIVFPYFTDATKYVQWMGTTATIKAIPGGDYRVHMRDGVETVGRFVEIDPPHRVVFTWGWTNDTTVPPGSSRVEVTLHPDEAGTRVVLRHSGLPTAEQREHHKRGWELYLGRLEILATGGDPGGDPNAVADQQSR